MLIQEVLMSTDSAVDWLTTELKYMFNRAIDVARRTYDSCGDVRIAKMHGYGTVGKWYNENTIKRGGMSLESLLQQLKPHNVKLPAMMTIGEKPSGRDNLYQLLEELYPVLMKRGYSKNVALIQSYKRNFNELLRTIGLDEEEPIEKVKKQPKPNVDANAQAHGIIEQVIQSLPKAIQHDVRMECQRAGFTLQALRDILKKRGIQL